MLKNFLLNVEQITKAGNIAVGSGISVNQLMETAALLGGLSARGNKRRPHETFSYMCDPVEVL